METLERLIRDLIYEMKDDRNDGYTQEFYRKKLEDMKKLIEKALK